MFHIPKDFIEHTREFYGAEAADAWFQRLPALLEEYAERWHIKLLPPFESLSFHYVAPAICENGTAAVLKTSEFSDEFEHGLAALRLFDGKGIARLLEYDQEKR